MTPDPAADPVLNTQIPSTAGMTTKVVKGSLWTLAGQVLPLFAALLTTPFIIRLLGSESYGVLLLVGLIPNYFAFADFGMGMASTKFASEAYGQGSPRREGEVVRTAALIALISASAIALPMFLLSGVIIGALNVPAHLQGEATTALRLTSVSFVVAILSGVLNTPQLSRLRMDLNASINAAGRVLLAAGTVPVLYLGGGIVGAAVFGLSVGILGLAAHIAVSGRLLGDLFGTSFDRAMIKPLAKFGGGLLVSGIASILLINLEKLLLTRMISVQSLAYYSVAFTFANMATLFSWAMVQSLIPAFSQLLSPEKKGEFDALFSRSIRLSIIWLLPTLMVLFVIAKPFFTIWAGPEFGAESTVPFYILLLGLVFNISAYVPYTAIAATGRTDIFAKLSWIELAFYVVAAVVLIKYFGIIGAAAAWSFRVTIDAFVLIWFSKKFSGVTFRFFDHAGVLALAILLLLPPIILDAFYDISFPLLIGVAFICIITYSIVIWKSFIDPNERAWIANRVHNLLDFTG